MRGRASIGAILLGVLALVVARPAAETPPLDEVLVRAGAYVERFEQQLSGIVAEETYIQEAQDVAVGYSGSVRHGDIQKRTLKSDLLLVRPVGAESWVQFRDVFAVDGAPVRDRNDRLERLFLDPTSATADQVGRIVFESARFNIGSIKRTINVPVLPLMFLDSAHRGRFRFHRIPGTDRRAAQPQLPEVTPSPLFRASTEVWVVQFDEVQRPTIIRTTRGKDLKSRGRFWIEPDTGRVLMTELIAESSDVHAQIDVSYESAPLVGFLVPIGMHEIYAAYRDRAWATGIATYGNIRQFQVKVDEKLGPIPRR